MAALSSVFLRPRALGQNPFPTGDRREDFMRTTGVYKVFIVGGGGGGAGGSPNGLYYGNAGVTTPAGLGTVRVRDGVTVTVGIGGSGGQSNSPGSAGTPTIVDGDGVTSAISGSGSGGQPGSYIDPRYSTPYWYKVLSGGARPNIGVYINNTQGEVAINAGRGGSSSGPSGTRGANGTIYYNLIFRVA